MSWKRVKIGEILKQYRIEHRVQNEILYKQVSILNNGGVVLRGEKIGKEIGRKRQFLIDINKYPETLIFTRQLLLQGSIGLANTDVHNCIVTENMPMFSVNIGKVNVEYLIQFIKSSDFKDQVGKIELTGSAQKSIHEKTFLRLEIPLPSLYEQKTIVNSLKVRNLQVNTISTELNYQLSLVKQLRQQFLQEAVQGKLVKQNPKDEPASELLKKIKAEKQKILKDKKKKEKDFLPVIPEEIPYSIPENWIWCKLGELFDIVRGSSPRPKGDLRYFSKQRTEYHWITIADFAKHSKFNVLNDTSQFLTEEGSKQSREVNPRDLLIAASGVGSVGKSSQVGITGYIYDGIMAIKSIPNQTITTYLSYFLKVKELEIYSIASGANWLNINTDLLNNYLLPLPPLAEQNRIVQKLDGLMQTCDKLEGSIKQSASYNEKLLQQVLREALRKE